MLKTRTIYYILLTISLIFSKVNAFYSEDYYYMFEKKNTD